MRRHYDTMQNWSTATTISKNYQTSRSYRASPHCIFPVPRLSTRLESEVIKLRFLHSVPSITTTKKTRSLTIRRIAWADSLAFNPSTPGESWLVTCFIPFPGCPELSDRIRPVSCQNNYCTKAPRPYTHASEAVYAIPRPSLLE